MFRAVTQQLRRARDILASVGELAESAAAVLDPRLLPRLGESETFSGFAVVQTLVARWLHQDHQQLERLEEGHRDSLRQLKKLRLDRDAARDGLYTILLRIRRTFEDAFGPGLAPIYLGLEPGLAIVEPLVLRRYAREAINILSNPDFVPPAALVQGLWENPQQYAEQIADALKPLEARLDEVAAYLRVVEKAQLAKTELLETLQTRLTWATRFFEAIYHLADLGFHAERLRPPRDTSRSDATGSRSQETSPEQSDDSESKSDGESPPDETTEAGSKTETTETESSESSA